MTREQEKEKRTEYQSRIDAALRSGTPEALQELRALCDEDRYLYLAEQDRELTTFRRIMLLWELEQKRTPGDTIVERTAAFWEEPVTAVTAKQLLDSYAILKFAILRLGSELPEEAQTEGICRALALGFSTAAILFAAKTEAEDPGQALVRFADLLETPQASGICADNGRMAAILRGVAEKQTEEEQKKEER